MTQAIQLGMDALWRTAGTHREELERLIPVAQRLARERGRVTTEDVRRVAGLIESRGRALSFLGALMKLAGLRPTGTYRRSELPASHGNFLSEWEMPTDDAR